MSMLLYILIPAKFAVYAIKVTGHIEETFINCLCLKHMGKAIYFIVELYNMEQPQTVYNISQLYS